MIIALAICNPYKSSKWKVSSGGIYTIDKSNSISLGYLLAVVDAGVTCWEMAHNVCCYCRIFLYGTAILLTDYITDYQRSHGEFPTKRYRVSPLSSTCGLSSGMEVASGAPRDWTKI